MPLKWANGCVVFHNLTQSTIPASVAIHLGHTVFLSVPRKSVEHKNKSGVRASGYTFRRSEMSQ